jgi:hypothetical protein
MDDRTRKLGLAGMGVALFAGFVALTEWTGDDPGSIGSLDDSEQSDLVQFCAVFSSGFVPYDTLLRVASGELAPEVLSETGLMDSVGVQSLAQSQINLLADRVPEEYGADARHAAEGLERALDGDLDPDEVEEYVASFARLEEAAAEDCEAVEGLDFGDGDGGPFGDGGDGDGGGFGEADGGPFGSDGDGGSGDGEGGGFGGEEPPVGPPGPGTIPPP